MLFRLTKATATAFVMLCACGEQGKEQPKRDRPYYPSMVTKLNNHRVVVFTNRDLRYSHGTVLKLDDTGNLSDATYIPSFTGDLFESKDHKDVFISNRQYNQIIHYTAEQLTGKCDSEPCEPKLELAYIPVSSPTHIAWLQDDPTTVWGIAGGQVTSQARYPNIALFSFDRVKKTFSTNKKSYDLSFSFFQDDNTALLNPLAALSVAGIKVVGELVIVALDGLMPATTDSLQQQKSLLLIFPKSLLIEQQPITRSTPNVVTLDITGITQAKQVGAIYAPQESAGSTISLWIAMQHPGLLLYAELTKGGEQWSATILRNGALCKHPTDVLYHEDLNVVDVACYDDDILARYDARTLALLKRHRVLKQRAPLNIFSDADKLYVTYDLSSTIGVFNRTTFANEAYYFSDKSLTYGAP